MIHKIITKSMLCTEHINLCGPRELTEWFHCTILHITSCVRLYCLPTSGALHFLLQACRVWPSTLLTRDGCVPKWKICRGNKWWMWGLLTMATRSDSGTMNSIRFWMSSLFCQFRYSIISSLDNVVVVKCQIIFNIVTIFLLETNVFCIHSGYSMQAGWH